MAGSAASSGFVEIGRNHLGNDILWISAWEVFGSLIE
jgi:hypothetical protein